MPNPLTLLFNTATWTVGKSFELATSGGLTRTAFGAGVGGAIGAAGGYDTNSRLEGFARGALLGGVAGGSSWLAPKIARTGWRGGKILWNANMALGARSAMKRARLMEFGTTKAVGALSKPMAFEAGNPLTKLAMSPAGRAVDVAGTGVARTGMWALNNPLMAGGLAVAGGAAMLGVGTGQPMTSPSYDGTARMNTSYNQQKMAVSNLGQIGMGTIGPPQEMQELFAYQDWMKQTGQYMAANSRFGRLADSTVGLPQGLHAGRHG